MNRVSIGTIFYGLLCCLLLAAMVPTCGWAISLLSVDIQANGSDGPVAISPQQALEVTVQTAMSDFSLRQADWWLVCDTGQGLYYFDLQAGWVAAEGGLETIPPSYQGFLFPLPPTPVLDITGLPTGTYTFYFGIDTTMDGILSYDSLIYDQAIVVVSTTPSVPDCRATAGFWVATYEETDCTGKFSEGLWFAVIDEDCHMTAVSNDGLLFEGEVDASSLTFSLTGDDLECGGISATGSIDPAGTISGTYGYETGGNGSFMGTTFE